LAVESTDTEIPVSRWPLIPIPVLQHGSTKGPRIFVTDSFLSSNRSVVWYR
jgi:hypothetical protein